MKNLSFLFTTNCNWFSQQDAWVYFNGKPILKRLLDPLKCYQRALDRRTNQNIPLDLKDVPVELLY
jgi:hypothetical protein